VRGGKEAMVDIQTKRAYEDATRDDGYRVLVDRLWPRGKRKADAKLDAWLKDLAPSNELRVWFGHDPERWKEFASRYRSELRTKEHREMLADLAKRARHGRVTLVYGARDTEHNEALVLQSIIERMGKTAAARS
jgi:uncharacterized protein YeaO (DUF488 family)